MAHIIVTCGLFVCRARARPSQQIAVVIRDVERQPVSVINGNWFVSPAAAFITAGDREAAWRMLIGADELRLSIPHMLREPLFESPHSDPRYAAFLKRLNLG